MTESVFSLKENTTQHWLFDDWPVKYYFWRFWYM